jgi:cysteinyl-tRNA synthetase
VLQLFDTASQKTKELRPRKPGIIGLYVCGPTVYGPAHVGHGRAVLTYDILRRYLEFRGFEVHHVANITDIDDKIINLANAEGRSWEDVAQHWEEQWWSTMDALGALRPVETPHATEYVDKMVELISSLVIKGFAYASADGVYLRAGLVPDYGLLSHQSIEDRRAGARVELDENKESPVDFALWKLAKPGEPTWPSPWGDGRPGWHTECVVMSLALLGEDFELHGGGQDLIFPHHDNERAQAVADDHLFARHWMHNGLVTVAGEKMSKSLNNFTTLRQLLEYGDARSYRLLVLGAHYRSPIEVNPTTIGAAASALSRIDALVRRLDGAEPSNAENATSQADLLHQRFIALMDNDLDTPGAIAEIFESVRRANSLVDGGELGAAATIAQAVGELLGALGIEIGVEIEGDDESDALVAKRDAARANRDFATSDAIRVSLEDRGWIVEDTPTGTRIHR